MKASKHPPPGDVQTPDRADVLGWRHRVEAEGARTGPGNHLLGGAQAGLETNETGRKQLKPKTWPVRSLG